MITARKLSIYESFGGDLDGWTRSARGAGTTEIADEDWYLIDELLLGLRAIASGDASASYRCQVEDKLNAATEDRDCRERLRVLARTR